MRWARSARRADHGLLRQTDRVRPGQADATIAQEEIFGPVLSIIAYEDEDDAVRIANSTIYGLAAAVWSSDEARAARKPRLRWTPES